MRILFLIISSMIVGQLNAQLSFFVKPVLEIKSDISSTSSRRFSDYNINPSPYYHYNNMAIQNPFKGFDYGLTLGFKTKSEKYMFELGVCGDQTQSGYTLTKLMSNGQFYYESDPRYVNGRAFPRIFIQNSFQIKEFKNKSKLYFITGLGFTYRKNDVLGLIGVTGETVQVDDNTFLTRESGLSVNSLKNVFIHAGLSSEIHSKNKYLFDFSVFYSHGFREMSEVVTKLTVSDNIGSKQINYYSVSSGSGFYFQVARKFQVHPWKGRRTKSVKE